jgi:hypothetical protein
LNFSRIHPVFYSPDYYEVVLHYKGVDSLRRRRGFRRWKRRFIDSGIRPESDYENFGGFNFEVQLDKKIAAIDSEALGLLKRYDWPGNIRELKHTVERAAIVCRGGVIRARDIALMVDEIDDGDDDDDDALVTLEECERRYILEVLQHTGWVIRGEQGAAAVLGLNPGTLYSRMKKLQIQRPLKHVHPRHRRSGDGLNLVNTRRCYRGDGDYSFRGVSLSTAERADCSLG